MHGTSINIGDQLTITFEKTAEVAAKCGNAGGK